MKAKELEKQHGKPLKEILIEAFARHQTQKAVAAELGVSQGTVSLWLKMSGIKLVYFQETTYALTDKGRAHLIEARS